MRCPTRLQVTETVEPTFKFGDRAAAVRMMEWTRVACDNHRKFAGTRYMLADDAIMSDAWTYAAQEYQYGSWWITVDQRPPGEFCLQTKNYCIPRYFPDLLYNRGQRITCARANAFQQRTSGGTICIFFGGECRVDRSR